MFVQQLKNAVTLYGVRLPKYALIAFQEANGVRHARYVWVEDPRTTGEYCFRIRALDCVTGKIYSFLGDTRKSSVANAFAKCADALPIEQICKPVYTNAHDYCACGPKDRLPQKFISRGVPMRLPDVTDYSVVANCTVGRYKYREEGYWAAVLKND